jgi:hypothetical protein
VTLPPKVFPRCLQFPQEPHRRAQVASAVANTAACGFVIYLRRKFIERESALAHLCIKQCVEPTVVPRTVGGGGYMTRSNWHDSEVTCRHRDYAMLEGNCG